GSAANAATSERKNRDNCPAPAIRSRRRSPPEHGHLHYRRQRAESHCARPPPPHPARASYADKCCTTGSSVLLVRKEFLDLCQHAFLDHAPPIRVAFEYCPAGVLHLIECGVRRDRRHVWVAVHVQQ